MSDSQYAIPSRMVPPTDLRYWELVYRALSSHDNPHPIAWFEETDDGQLVLWEASPEDEVGRPALPLPVAQSKRVQLFAEGVPPLIDGQPVEIPSPSAYEVILALLESYPARLSKDDLVSKSGRPDPLKALHRLADNSEAWRQVIGFAGVKGHGYGIE